MSKKKSEISPSIKKIMEKEFADMDEIETQQRFGFFSIIPNNLIGDRYYSMNKEYHHKVVDHKVINEKRGIFTTIGKSGKGPDVYFKNMVTMDPHSQELLKKGFKEDQQKLFAKVKARKEQGVIIPFKPADVHHYKDYFEQNPVERKGPLYRIKKINHKGPDGKVITEKRGIYTNNMKKGLYNTPGIYFSFIPFREDLEAKDLKTLPRKKRPQTSIPEQKAYKKAFFPASLKKNGTFQSDRDTYGYEDDYFEKLKKQSDLIRKTRGNKYTKYYPKGSIMHDRPFTPASLGKKGKEGLFDQHIWDCPQIPEKRIIINQRAKREYEQAHRKAPFYYNKIQKHSLFSPPIMTSDLNMKKDFPKFYKN